MYSTISTAETVRSSGALSPGGEGQAGPSDAQINASLDPARRMIVDRIGEDLYEEIRAYDSDDTDLLKRRDAFALAESYFALSHLAPILTDVQLEQSGVKKTIEIGKAVTVFNGQDDRDFLLFYWASEGWKAISDYIDPLIYDDDGNLLGIDTGDFGMMTL